MNGIMSRMRSAMQLLLLSALLMLWQSTRIDPDIVAIAKDLANADDELWPSSKMPRAIKEYKQLQPEDYSFDRSDKLLELVPQEVLDVIPSVKQRLASLGYAGGSDNPLQLASLSAFTDNLNDFSKAFDASSQDPSRPLRYVAQALQRQRRLKVPFLDQTLDPASGILAVSVAQFLLLIYLLSYMWTLRGVLIRQGPKGMEEFLFVHDGWLGVGLGGIWLMSPGLALAWLVAQGHFALSVSTRLICLAMLVAASAGCLVLSLGIRRQYRKQVFAAVKTQ